MHAKITVTDSSTSVLTLLISAFETKQKTKKSLHTCPFFVDFRPLLQPYDPRKGKKSGMYDMCIAMCIHLCVRQLKQWVKNEKYCNKCFLNLCTPQFQRRLKMINIFVHFPQTIQKSTIQQNWSYFIYLDLMLCW